MNVKRALVLALVAVGIAGVLWLLFHRHVSDSEPWSTESTAPPAPSVSAEAPAPSPSPTRAPPSPATPPPTPLAEETPTPTHDGGALPRRPPRIHRQSEAELMGRLRALGSSQPMVSLALAREGNRRFRNTADAPERAAIVVKSLVGLGRQEEAKTEALRMEKDYPSSPWTDDVHRRMSVNPSAP